jgi:TPR repeat protein
MLSPLLVASAIALLSLSLPAQERLPDSYLQKLATIDRLQKLTSTDLAVLTSRAQSGAAEAQYQLALVYGAGRIVPRDDVTSQRLMMKSAEQGYIPAETMIGCTYLDNHITGPVPNYVDAETWLRAAARQADPEAQLWLGLGYSREYFGRENLQPKAYQTRSSPWDRCTRKEKAFPKATREQPIGLEGHRTTSQTLAEFSARSAS